MEVPRRLQRSHRGTLRKDIGEELCPPWQEIESIDAPLVAFAGDGQEQPAIPMRRVRARSPVTGGERAGGGEQDQHACKVWKRHLHSTVNGAGEYRSDEPISTANPIMTRRR